MPATATEVRKASRRFRDFLLSRGQAEECADLADLLVVEAMNNVAEHAYRDLPPGPLRLSARLREGEILVEIEDQGHAMAQNGPAQKRLSVGGQRLISTDLASLPEGGFGWALLQENCHRLRYRRVAGCNRLTLALPASCLSPAQYSFSG